MRLHALAACCILAFLLGVSVARGAEHEPLPFSHKVEVYRDKDGQVIAFSLKLEQPFLAEEFEKSNYLRLQPLDRNAYLIYPPRNRGFIKSTPSSTDGCAAKESRNCGFRMKP